VSKVYEDIKTEMCGRTQQLLEMHHNSVGPTQPAIEQQSSSSQFDPIYQIDCQSLFMGFQCHLDFQFSFGPTALARRCFGPRYSFLVNGFVAPQGPSKGTSTQQPNPDDTSVSTDGDVMIALATRLLPVFTSKTAMGATVMVGGVYNLVGWRVIGATLAMYGGLYAYERLKYTNRAIEKRYKQQFCDYAGIKLQDIVTYTGNCCSTQVQRDLSSSLSRLLKSIDNGSQALKTEIAGHTAEITRTKDVNSTAEKKRWEIVEYGADIKQFLTLFNK